jgi:hypothetical protein
MLENLSKLKRTFAFFTFEKNIGYVRLEEGLLT